MQRQEADVSDVRTKARIPTRARANGVRLLAGLVRWVALAAPLHFAWEWAHAPLYTLWLDGSRAIVAYSIAHCTAGDALIAAASYLVGAAYGGAASWPDTAPARGLAAAVSSGVGYTVFSEWLNVYRLGSWAYTESMPLLGGIGLTPLLQWLLVPLATVLLWRGLRPGDAPGQATPAAKTKPVPKRR